MLQWKQKNCDGGGGQGFNQDQRLVVLLLLLLLPSSPLPRPTCKNGTKTSIMLLQESSLPPSLPAPHEVQPAQQVDDEDDEDEVEDGGLLSHLHLDVVEGGRRERGDAVHLPPHWSGWPGLVSTGASVKQETR